MSRVNSLHHIVFNTYRREPTIAATQKRELYKFIYGILQKNNCKLIRMGGVENHIHMLIDLHPTKSLSWLVGEIKRSSSLWMKESGLFPLFKGWAHEYFAASLSINDANRVIEYILNQEEHHKVLRFEDEIIDMCSHEKFEWDEKYFR